jgi:hypothetical protein
VRWNAGYVSHQTTRRNLLWCAIVAALVSFHACVWISREAEMENEDPASSLAE